MHVEEQEMVVSATGEHVHAFRESRLGERLRVLDDALRVVAESWLARLPKRDCFRGEDVRHRSTKDYRAALVDRLRELRRASDHSAAWTAHSLVRRRSD